MKRSGLILFGNHTRDHLSLNTLSYDEIKDQVLEADNELKKKLENIEYFAYPYGDLDDRAVEILKDAGFKYGMTCIEGVNDQDTNPYLLKRVFINDLNFQTRFLLKYPNLTFNLKSLYYNTIY